MSYHSQANVKVKLSGNGIITRLRRFVDEHKRECNMRWKPLKHSYNDQVHWWTKLPSPAIVHHFTPSPTTFENPTALSFIQGTESNFKALEIKLSHPATKMKYDADQEMILSQRLYKMVTSGTIARHHFHLLPSSTPTSIVPHSQFQPWSDWQLSGITNCCPLSRIYTG